MNDSLADLSIKIDGSKFFRELRNDRPVYFDPNYRMYVVSRYDDVLSALQQPNLFSAALALFNSYQHEDVVTDILISKGHGPFKRVLAMTDPPEHTRVRSLVNLAFSAQRVEKIRAHINELTKELIDGIIDGGHAEVVSTLASPLPVTVICDLLSLPRDRWQDVLRWTNAYTACVGNRIADVDEAAQFGDDLAELQNLIVERISSRRSTPGDDVLSDLIGAKSSEHAPLDDQDILAVAAAFLIAGHETSTIAITMAIKMLAERPDIVAQLRAAPGRDAAVRAFCNEVLRLEPPLNAQPRVATADAEIAGVRIPAGSPVLLLNASANRDEGVFGADSEELSLERPSAARHLTFGGGVHVCLGRMLALAELQSVTHAVLTRLDNLRLVNPNIPSSDYGPSIMDWNYRLKRLEIEFDAKLAA